MTCTGFVCGGSPVFISKNLFIESVKSGDKEKDDKCQA